MTGKERRYAKGLLWLSQLIPSPRLQGQTFIPSPVWEYHKVNFSCASSSKSVEKQSSARSLCTCPGMCPCATQEARCEDSCCHFHPSASVMLLMWDSTAADKRAVTFQGGWTAKPGPGPGESKVAVHRAGADVKGPRTVISGFSPESLKAELAYHSIYKVQE